MTDIYHQLTNRDFRQMDTDSLRDARNQYSTAFDGIMSGLRALGSMAFWARGSDGYEDEQAAEDLYSIGELLMHLPRIAEALRQNADDANFELWCREGFPVSPNTQTKTQIKTQIKTEDAA